MTAQMRSDHADEIRRAIDISVENPQTRVAVVRIRGEIDMLTTPAVTDVLRRQLAADLAALVVDLHGVTFLASSGLAALVQARDLAERRAIRLRLVATSRAVTRPVEAAGLTEVLVLHEDVDSAT